MGEFTRQIDEFGISDLSLKKKFPKVAQDKDFFISKAAEELSSTANPSTSFLQVLKEYGSQVNTLQHNADAQVQKYAAGIGDIDTLNLAMSEASISFDLMLQMRNKLEDALKEIKGMPA